MFWLVDLGDASKWLRRAMSCRDDVAKSTSGSTPRCTYIYITYLEFYVSMCLSLLWSSLLWDLSDCKYLLRSESLACFNNAIAILVLLMQLPSDIGGSSKPVSGEVVKIASAHGYTIYTYHFQKKKSPVLGDPIPLFWDTGNRNPFGS